MLWIQNYYQMNKSWFFTLISLLFFVQINGQQNRERIEKVLDDWHLAAAEADFDRYFSGMTTDAIFIGTDASENWKYEAFREFSKPYFDRGKAWNFKAVERNIYLNENETVAWFDELLDTWMGICRGSGVLLLQEGEWLVAHYVLSATIPNDDMDEVIAVKKELDSIQLVLLKGNKVISD